MVFFDMVLFAGLASHYTAFVAVDPRQPDVLADQSWMMVKSRDVPNTMAFGDALPAAAPSPTPMLSMPLEAVNGVPSGAVSGPSDFFRGLNPQSHPCQSRRRIYSSHETLRFSHSTTCFCFKSRGLCRCTQRPSYTIDFRSILRGHFRLRPDAGRAARCHRRRASSRYGDKCPITDLPVYR